MISPNLDTFYSTNFKLPIHLDDTVTRFYFFKDMNCAKNKQYDENCPAKVNM